MSVLTKQQWINKVIKSDEKWLRSIRKHNDEFIIINNYVFIKVNDELVSVSHVFNKFYGEYQYNLLPELSTEEQDEAEISSGNNAYLQEGIFSFNLKPVFAGDGWYLGTTKIYAHLNEEENHMWLIIVDQFHDLDNMYKYCGNCVQKLDLPKVFEISELRKQLLPNRVYGNLICLFLI